MTSSSDHGPLEVLVITFEAGDDASQVVDAFRDVVESGAVSVIDFVLALRERAGSEVRLVDLETDLGPEEMQRLSWLAADPSTLLSDEDIELVLEVLPPERQAVILAVEHLWARNTADRLRAAGAELALHARVPTFDADKAFAATAG